MTEEENLKPIIEEETLEQIMQDYDVIASQLETLEAAKEIQREKIKNHPELKFDSMIVGKFSISKMKKIKPTMDIEKAKLFGVVITKETIDGKEFSKLVGNGTIKEGFEVSETIMIKDRNKIVVNKA